MRDRTHCAVVSTLYSTCNSVVYRCTFHCICVYCSRCSSHRLLSSTIPCHVPGCCQRSCNRCIGSFCSGRLGRVPAAARSTGGCRALSADERRCARASQRTCGTLGCGEQTSGAQTTRRPRRVHSGCGLAAAGGVRAKANTAASATTSQRPISFTCGIASGQYTAALRPP